MRGLRLFLFIIPTFLPAMASALDTTKMTPMNCSYRSGDIDTIDGKLDCGSFKICQKRVDCSYVDNEVLANKYGGNIEAAKKAGDRWYQDLTPVHNAKAIWSDLSGKNPSFINSSSLAYCISRGSKCPSARDCLIDKGITAVGSESSSQADTDKESNTSTGAAK